MNVGDASWIEPIFWIWVGIAAAIFTSLFFVDAPYGRHQRSGWGPEIPARFGWVIMECPSFFVLGGLLLLSNRTDSLSVLFGGLWCFHYFYRSFLYPFFAKMKGKTMPFSVALMAIVFNLGNGGFNGMTQFFWLPPLDASSIGWQAPVGAVLFIIGFCIHVHSDSVLWSLRGDGSTGYSIPQRGLHRWVASPNYFGELIQWLGLAIFAGHLAMWSFWIWTAANLVPRALAHRAWYAEKFAGYPQSRRALIPFLL